MGIGPARTGEELRDGESEDAGIAARAAVADPEGPEPPIGAGAGAAFAFSLPAAGPPARPPAPTCAAEAVIGFPQSMQNRDVASFSRPQKVQAVNRRLAGGKTSWGANIGMALGGVKSEVVKGVPNGANSQTALSSEGR